MLSEDIIAIPNSQMPIKRGVFINLDDEYMPVIITKDNIDYDFEDYINMLIDKKLNAEVESNNPCNNCQEFSCTYCDIRNNSKHNPCYDCQNDFDCHNCKYEYLQA